MSLIVYVLDAAIFALITSKYMVAELISALATEFGMSFATIDHLVTFYADAMVVGGPLLTTTLPRVSRKSILFGSIALFVVGRVTGVLVPGYVVMVTARLATAVAAVAFFDVAPTTCAELVESNQFGRVSLLMLGGLMAGTMPGLPVVIQLDEWYGWYASFFAVALVAVLIGPLMLQLAPTIPRSAGDGSLRGELEVLKNAYLWWVYATSLLLIGTTFAGFIYFVPILTEVSGFFASTVPLLPVVYGLAMLVDNNIIDCLTDRYIIVVLAFGLLVAIAAMMAFVLFGQVPAVAVATPVVIGLTGVLTNPTLVIHSVRVGRNNMLVNLVYTTCIMLGVMADSWIGGLGIAGGFGLQGAFWVDTALGVLALLTLLPEPRFAHAPVDEALGC